MKGIGGFYYVYVEGAGLYECRAKGIFRNKKMKPNVGDIVDIDVISEEEKTGNLTVIHKRKNQLIRPMVANVDQALVIFAVHEPEPNFQLLNRFLIMMEKQQVPVIICFNKMDLASEEERVRLKRDYEKSGCRVLFSSAHEGEGIPELKELLRGKIFHLKQYQYRKADGDRSCQREDQAGQTYHPPLGTDLSGGRYFSHGYAGIQLAVSDGHRKRRAAFLFPGIFRI